VPELTPETLHTKVHDALRAWSATTGGNDDELLQELLLVRHRLDRDSTPALQRLATNEVLLAAIDELEQQDPTAARILRSRFLDRDTLMMVANRMNVSEYTVSRLQRAAIEEVARILLAQEQALRNEMALEIESRLPPPSYTRLFGLEETTEELTVQLLSADAPWVIALVGIGGIGKTSLADRAVRQAIRAFHFAGVIWLRSQPHTMSGAALSPQLAFQELINNLAQQLLPGAPAPTHEQRLVQVRRELSTRPYLIVIDNLEAEEETAYVLSHLGDLAHPSKFLLTTRTRPRQSNIYIRSLNELSLADASCLLRHHARDINVQAMAEAGDEDIQLIYDTVGGNPLALKLVASLLDIMSLPQLLDDLVDVRSGAVEEFYHHIYRKTWHSLSEDGRSLLRAMPLISETGAGPEYLASISGLDEASLWPAIQELRSRSLLEVRGNLREKQYGIHRLTETFLRSEILNWPEGS
jgi:hypothetical protein